MDGQTVDIYKSEDGLFFVKKNVAVYFDQYENNVCSRKKDKIMTGDEEFLFSINEDCLKDSFDTLFNGME